MGISDAPGVRDLFLVLNGKHHIVSDAVFPRYKMHIICSHHLDAQFFSQLEDAGIG